MPQKFHIINIPFHITPYNKYVSSVASFKSALRPTFCPLDSAYFACVREVECHCFRACVCSGHIPHHNSDNHIVHMTSHYTAVCLPLPFHTTTKHNMFHITQPQSTSHNYSTPLPHSTSQHISHHTIFHITPPDLDFTSHHHI